MSSWGSCLDASLVELALLGEVLARVDVDDVDRAGCERVLSALAVIRRRVDGCEIRVTRRLAALAEQDPCSPSAGEMVARASRRDARAGAKAQRRADTTAAVPELGDAVERGDASGEHVDAVADALARLPEALRGAFAARHGEQLAVCAASGTPGQVRTLATRLAAGFEDEHTRQARLARQRRSNRLRWWLDRTTGMVRLTGELDPELGQAVLRRLHDEIEARFHGPGALPDSCPDDPNERQDHLRALALCALVLGAGSSDRRTARRPETITVIDTRTYGSGWHPDSYVDHGVDGLDLPLDTIRRRALLGDVIPVWVDEHGVVIRVGDPAQPLDLGRTTRLANRAQRHALRVMYRTCAIPGCDVPFDHCQPHHIRWWRHGGRTDLSNLLPLCTRHHHAIHDHAWQLHLAPDRTLTITRPDGTTTHTGPTRTRRRRC